MAGPTTARATTPDLVWLSGDGGHLDTIRQAVARIDGGHDPAAHDDAEIVARFGRMLADGWLGLQPLPSRPCTEPVPATDDAGQPEATALADLLQTHFVEFRFVDSRGATDRRLASRADRSRPNANVGHPRSRRADPPRWGRGWNVRGRDRGGRGRAVVDRSRRLPRHRDGLAPGSRASTTGPRRRSPCFASWPSAGRTRSIRCRPSLQEASSRRAGSTTTSLTTRAPANRGRRGSSPRSPSRGARCGPRPRRRSRSRCPRSPPRIGPRLGSTRAAPCSFTATVTGFSDAATATVEILRLDAAGQPEPVTTLDNLPITGGALDHAWTAPEVPGELLFEVTVTEDVERTFTSDLLWVRDVDQPYRAG